MSIIDKMMDSVKIGDRDSGTSSFLEWNVSKYGNILHLNTLEKFLETMGNQWHNSELSLAQVFVAVKIVEDILQSDLEYVEKDSTDKNVKKGPIVIGNIEDDFHGLGRKIVVAFLKASNWDVIDLGNDISAEEFVEVALEENAKIIAVSAMMYTTASNIKKVSEILNEQGLSNKIKLIVGGAVFRLVPSLVEEVGADGTADSAINVPSYFAELWKEVTEVGDAK